MKLKDHSFDIIEVFEAEWQVVLNTHTELDFLYAFKNGKSAGNGVYVLKGTTSRLMGACRPKVSS
jgi:hypothetical protein